MDMTDARMFYCYLVQDFSFVIECSVANLAGKVFWPSELFLVFFDWVSGEVPVKAF